ncbi:hypothetical protein KY084_12710 [Stakelama sp. CBK3Z-3]|uniref:Lipoprotein n=1 Tax=Stakelama flava TaxID=2860338 RepID=A0ABS6XNE0_9SPHN|nr:hypothetical protein [Stakelama flava]MBW4331732.1 hypothetical protein [Stakelama flava]
MTRIILIPLAAAALSGCAAASSPPAEKPGPDRLTQLLTGYEPTDTLQCIDPDRVQYSETVRGGIVYRSTLGHRIYVSEISPACITPRSDDILISYPFAGRYCKGDRVKWVSRIGGPSGFCTLGRFAEYTRAQPAE